jgi:hypothetical protein
MKKILKIAVIMLILAGGSFSCGEENDVQQNDIVGAWEDENELGEIPFTEYSLSETSCIWTNLALNKIIIVNSDTKLEKYIICTGENYPAIDFSKNTLLLASGGTSYGVEKTQSTLVKNSTEKYTLKVVVHLNDAPVIERWRISILSPKISSKSTIDLDVQIIR